MTSLKEVLKAIRKRTAHGYSFVPDGELTKLLTKERVLQQLLECNIPTESLEETLQVALTKAIKVFAILVRSGQEALMLECIENDLIDYRLPLETSVPGLQLNDKFFKVQWEFLAPIFTKRTVVLKLKDEHILPFLEDTKIDQAHGGYADAFRVSLDPDHQALVDLQVVGDGQETVVGARNPRLGAHVVLFRKELKSIEDGDGLLDTLFREEDRILKMVNALNNENIVHAYLSYRHRGAYSFLFPLADGDLSGLICSNTRPPALETDAAIVKALHGLAAALAAVHNFNSKTLGAQFKGCHHDLKPQNILVSGSKFLLADFGLSTLKALEDDSKSTSKSIGDYLAPECRNTNNQRQLIGRKSDIWSFGCIISEVLAYMDSGPDGVEHFRSTRMIIVDQWTNYAFHSSGQVKTSVQQWLSSISERGKPGYYALILDLIRHMLQPDPRERPDGTVVQRVLCCLEAKLLLDDSLQLYSLLAARYEDTYLLVEGERLRAWGSTLGVFQPRGPWRWSACRHDSLNQSALDLLQSTYNELHSMETAHDPQNRVIDTAMSVPGATVLDLGEGLLEGRRLHACNDQLVALLDPVDKRTVSRFLFRRILRIEDVNGLRRIESDVETYVGVAEIQPLAQLKLIFQLAQEKELSGELKHKIPLDGKVVVTGTMEHHSRGRYCPPTGPDEQVLIEWRPINSPSEPVSQELLLRVDALAGLSSTPSKPAGIRILDCVGYYLDKKRRAFGVLYHFPQLTGGESGERGEPMSLFQLIASTANSTHGRPYLGTRFAIARSIASCILYCHSINWLHERLNSFNVVFFSSSGKPAATPQTLPFVVGFDHSRQDKKKAFSHGPPSDERFQHYLHPDYSNRRPFKKIFDYYSVGLVLLEIGLWRTLESITSQYKFHDREGTRKEVVDRDLPGLLCSMGEIYYQTVRACLDHGLGSQDSSDEDVATSFQQLVVDRLERCMA